ncbi:MAG: hypothetical protein M1825_000767 [Sarcosagium campestre]|nr:MAG: hypothetical protein M1825_000767 [Sarcosagium campestre]
MDGRLNGREVVLTHEKGDGKDTLTWEAKTEYPKDQDQGPKEPATAGQFKSQDIICIVRDARDPASKDNLGPTYTLLSVSRDAPHNSDSAAQSAESSLQSDSIQGIPSSFLEAHLLSKLPSHLTLPPGPEGPNIHVLISTLSGTHRAEGFVASVLRPLLGHLGIPETAYKVHRTVSSQTITELTTSIFLPRARRSVLQTVLLLSGDGGVNDIINALRPTDPPATTASSYTPPSLCVLPFGTANALALSLHTVKLNGLHALLYGTPHRLPLLHTTFSPLARPLAPNTTPLSLTGAPGSAHGSKAAVPTLTAAIVVSYGFHASLVADSDSPELRKMGAARFQHAANALLYPPGNKPPHAYRARVSLLRPPSSSSHPPPDPPPSPSSPNCKTTKDGSPVQSYWTTLERTTHAYILLTLVPRLEPSFTISPRSDPRDPNSQRPYLVHFGALPAADIMRLMQAAYDGGRHVDVPEVGYEAVDGIRVEMLDNDDDDSNNNDSNDDDGGGGDGSDGRWRRVCVDGRIVELEPGGWFEVRRSGPDTSGNDDESWEPVKVIF